MSQPKTTSQKPKPPSSALFSLSRLTYLPRSTPSMSKPPILARATPLADSSATSFSCVGWVMGPARYQEASRSGSPERVSSGPRHAMAGLPERGAEAVVEGREGGGLAEVGVEQHEGL